MRSDGRRSDELRDVTIQTGVSAYAEGSALISLGRTRVLCTLTVEDIQPRWMAQQGKSGGWLTAEYAMLPRATAQRTPRETAGLGGRTQEIRRLIGRSLRAALDLEKLGPRTCIMDCDVLQADGGTRTAAISGGYVALAAGLQELARRGELPHGVVKSAVAAVSVGLCDGLPCLDLCYEEDSRADVDANVVMNAEGHFIEVQVSAEGSAFRRAQLDTLLNLAYKGIGQLLAAQREALGLG